MTDIRWIQRLNNYSKALQNLKSACELSKKRKLSQLEKQGLIQAFEFTYELAWKTIKEFFVSQGDVEILGSRDAFTLAFNRGLVTKGDVLMDIIKSRQRTSHTYNETQANEIYNDIIQRYSTAFEEIYNVLNKEKEKRSD